MKIFICWSGETSRQVACVLRDKLPYIIQAIKPFISTDDIGKGARWSDILANELKDTDIGIICITPYNIKAPWLNFESGALAKSVGRSCVAPFLFKVEPSQLRGPLAQFQSTVCQKEDIFNLLVSLNSKLDSKIQLEHNFLRETFDRWWDDLDKALGDIHATKETSTGHDWLYTLCELNERIGPKIDSKSILVVSPSPDLDLESALVKKIVEDNLTHGIQYRIMVSGSTTSGEMAGIKSLFWSKTGQNMLHQIPDAEFQSMAVTIYILLNYEPPMNANLRAFIKLPAGKDDDYWMEVNAEAARGFALRFGDLLNRFEGVPIGDTGTLSPAQ